ncbi:MAG TPA: SPOR domain-containing protein [Candidatus Eisenbacteria bacterium]|nr:SPOR domain-containing protein [Candidatus Eisenbacteria bacterium]
MTRKPLAMLMALALSASVSAAQASDLDTLLARTPSDSLPATLRRLETSADPGAGARAVMVLGQLHYARGEFRHAAAAFGRAAARLAPGEKPRARYAQGLAFLGLGEPTQARAALEDVARTSTTLREPALLGLAQAWEVAERPEKALETLEPLLGQPLGETGPTILERIAALAERADRQDEARRARERLLKDYPRSIEAASARAHLAASAQRPGAGTIAVVIGQFVDRGRARALAAEAKRAGFPNAQVITRGQGLSAIHVVRLGAYGSAADARQAGELAVRALGVTYQVVRAE